MLPEFETFAPCPLLAPAPVVLVSCRGKEENALPNLITIGWAGIVCSDPPMVSVSIRKERYSHELISQTKEYVINLVNKDILQATDFCGVKSGRDLDKFEHCGLTAINTPPMAYAPAVAQSPAHLACEVKQIIELGSHDMFIGQVMGVKVHKNLMDESGNLHLESAGLVCYNHGLYQSLDEVLGFFGYSVAKEGVFEKRMAKYHNNKFSK